MAICKAKECAEMEEVLATGAVRPWDSVAERSKAPAAVDNAACIPNQAWYDSETNEEEARHSVFYACVGVSMVIFLAVLICLFTRGVGVGVTRTRAAVATTLVLLRTLEFVTDWGFYDLSVATPRFELLMKNDGYDYTAFSRCCLASCIFGSLLYVPDLMALHSKIMAQEAQRPPPMSALWVTLATLLLEDVPQCVMCSLYLSITQDANSALCDMYKEPFDVLALLAVLVSLSGIVVNVLYLLAPQLFFNLKDEMGQKLPPVADPFALVAATLTGSYA